MDYPSAQDLPPFFPDSSIGLPFEFQNNSLAGIPKLMGNFGTSMDTSMRQLLDMTAPALHDQYPEQSSCLFETPMALDFEELPRDFNLYTGTNDTVIDPPSLSIPDSQYILLIDLVFKKSKAQTKI
ncbi:hypothetical protein HD806DRAFT_532163 [Xylariaceae sp. AK1471]|nr:hypothetical protein HD806DRAFT_532163 [Xylariaceae sp. AK1471]